MQFVGLFMGEMCLIGLEAPGDYLDKFWSNKRLFLLLERPKSQNAMMSGFLSPGEPLFMDLDIPKILQNI